MHNLDAIRAALSTKLPTALVNSILSTFTDSVTKLNSGDYDNCLVKAGLFSEHVLRALVFDATGSVPKEIKSVNDAIKLIEKSGINSEALRVLVPRILGSSAYDLRSKRGAVHVKGVDPQRRDAVLAVTACSWTLAELLTEYGNISGSRLDNVISSLMRRKLPLVETINGDAVVTANLPTHFEALIIIDGRPDGISRRELGKLVKRSPSSVTHALTKLNDERLAHQSSNLWFITGKGEEAIAGLL
jgi:HEPN domain-containing protein